MEKRGGMTLKQASVMKHYMLRDVGKSRVIGHHIAELKALFPKDSVGATTVNTHDFILCII